MPVQSSRGRVLSTDNKKYEVVKRTRKTKRNFKFTSFIFVQNSFHAEPAHKIFVLVAKVPLSQILFVLLKQVNTLEINLISRRLIINSYSSRTRRI